MKPASIGSSTTQAIPKAATENNEIDRKAVEAAEDAEFKDPVYEALADVLDQNADLAQKMEKMQAQMQEQYAALMKKLDEAQKVNEKA